MSPNRLTSAEQRPQKAVFGSAGGSCQLASSSTSSLDVAHSIARFHDNVEIVVAQFQDFIDRERWRFEAHDGNLFHMAFREIVTYRSFLQSVISRHDAIAVLYRASIEAQHQSIQGRVPGTPLTPDELAQLNVMGEQGRALRMEIESFYLFSAILLDRVAAAVGFYFEGRPSAAWERHSTLVKRIGGYSRTRNIAVPERFQSLAESLKTAISNFRHEQVVHERSLRALRATGFRTGEGPRLLLSNLYPTPDDRQYESMPLGELVLKIDEYLNSVIQLIVENRARTPLTLDGQANAVSSSTL
jgi:hypothetical protein